MYYSEAQSMLWILVILLLAQFAISTALSVLNLAHLKRTANALPQGWGERLDVSQFPRMIAYLQARTRLGHLARVIDLGVILAILLSGFLSMIGKWASSLPIAPVWQGLIVLSVPAAIAYLADIPFDLLSQFGVERRFGFSTITAQTWAMDQLKSLLLALMLGTLLGGGLLLLIGWLGSKWWLPAWIALSLFQLLMAFVAPVLILPLFNKFDRLQDERLGEQIFALAHKAGFPLGGVFQVNASLRSRHSNAYFTGLGKTRRIALYDTLLEQHPHEEILAILAHEIGHWKLGHIAQSMVVSILVAGGSMLLAAALLDAHWLYTMVGLGSLHAQLGTTGPVAAAGLFLIGILLSPLSLLLAPIANWFSRKHEYQADAYSLALYNHLEALEASLLRLSEKNLSNLFPHPLVVVYRYSHPPLLDRIAAIRAQHPQDGRHSEAAT
jgi:STE24 endopeptidase